jgi:hypothetical protein
MKPILLLLIGLLCLTVTVQAQAPSKTADPNPVELIAAATRRPWPGENYPVLPALSSTMQDRVVSEIASSPAVRAAFNQLNATRGNRDWAAGIEALEQQKAIWSLQAALCHPSEDVQVLALRALGRLNDKQSVPFILLYADYMSVLVIGSESATVHGIIQHEIAESLSHITGVPIQIDGQDPEGLQKAIRRWTRWQLDQPQ